MARSALPIKRALTMNMSQEFLENLEETITIGRGNEAASEDTLLGTTFAQKYEMLELLGRGGMSIVYRARHTGMDKIVAVKVLHLHLSKDELSLKRFKQEAQAASTLTHPGIVAIHDCGEAEDKTPYLVMDLVEGISLSDLIEKEGTLDLDRFLSIMTQVSAALAHAHSCGIVHRDLKPSNIMISSSAGKDIARIVDFGIAKVLTQSSEGAQQLTQTGEVFGSPLYMSPEQCTGTAIDHRADIYSLGCVMYEALCGKTPFKGETVFETINKHINALPPPLVTEKIKDDGLRQKLELILLKALAKAPQDRYASMTELEKELQALRLKSRVGILGSLGGAWDLASAKRRASRKNRLPIMVVSLTTVSVLSAASVLLLMGALNKAGHEIKRLEQSRRVLSEISLAQSDFTAVSENARDYFISIMLTKKNTAALREKYETTQKASGKRMERVDEVLKAYPKMQEKFRKVWRKKLDHVALTSKKMLRQAEAASGSWSLDILSVSLQLSKICSEGADVLQKMTDLARSVEKEEMGQFELTEKWIASLALLCAGLNTAVVIVLFAYFAKGTPQRIKKLAEQAAQLSRRRGGSQTASSQDVVADLDNVLQELATALSEAEEREQLLLKKLQDQQPSEEKL